MCKTGRECPRPRIGTSKRKIIQNSHEAKPRYTTECPTSSRKSKPRSVLRPPLSWRSREPLVINWWAIVVLWVLDHEIPRSPESRGRPGRVLPRIRQLRRDRGCPLWLMNVFCKGGHNVVAIPAAAEGVVALGLRRLRGCLAVERRWRLWCGDGRFPRRVGEAASLRLGGRAEGVGVGGGECGLRTGG